MLCLPTSVAEIGMSKRALSTVVAARSARVSLAFLTDSPAGGVSARLIGASGFTCQPLLALMVRLAVAVAPTATLGVFWTIS